MTNSHSIEEGVSLIPRKSQQTQKNLTAIFRILFLSLPRCIENVIYLWAPGLILTLYAGHVSVEALTDVTLGYTIYRITIRTISGGLGMTGASIFGQAYGNGNYRALGILLQRLLFVGFVLICLISLGYIPLESILQAIGQEPQSASDIATFVYFLIPVSLFDNMFWTASVYFQAQKILFLQIIIAFIGIFVEILFSWLFTYKFVLNISGLSLGFGSYFVFNGTCMIVSICIWHWRMEGMPEDPWKLGFSKLAFKDLKSLIFTIFNSSSSFLIICFTVDFLALASSLLDNSTLYLAVAGILSTILNFGATLFYGLGVYCGILIAIEVGNGNKDGIMFVIKVMILGHSILCSIIITFLIYFQNDIGSWWTNDKDVQDEVTHYIPYACAFMIGAAITRGCVSVLIGAKRQRTLLIMIILGMFCLCVPFSLILSFVFNYGFKGLFIGYVTSYIAQSIFFTIFCLTINWEKEIELTEKELSLLRNSLNSSTDNFD